MEVRELAPFGVEITGLDAGHVGVAEADELARLLAEHGVACLRGQAIGDDQFVAFLERFGPLTFTQGEEPLAHQPALNFVTNVGRTTPPRSVFHTDTSYVSCPPAFTALRGVSIPEAGGETVFSNQYTAYEALPADLRERLAGATVQHGVTGVNPGESEATTRHPLFRRHPVSGRTALFLSTPERCSAISGVDADDSARTIAFLYEHSTRAETLYRHRWRPGDIVIWDNRCTMHRADHSGVVGERVMHRGMVAGEAPLAA